MNGITASGSPKKVTTWLKVGIKFGQCRTPLDALVRLRRVDSGRTSVWLKSEFEDHRIRSCLEDNIIGNNTVLRTR